LRRPLRFFFFGNITATFEALFEENSQKCFPLEEDWIVYWKGFFFKEKTKKVAANNYISLTVSSGFSFVFILLSRKVFMLQD